MSVSASLASVFLPRLSPSVFLPRLFVYCLLFHSVYPFCILIQTFRLCSFTVFRHSDRTVQGGGVQLQGKHGVVVVGAYFEYMAVKPLIVPSYTFFKGFTMHAIIIFLKLLAKASKSYFKF